MAPQPSFLVSCPTPYLTSSPTPSHITALLTCSQSKLKVQLKLSIARLRMIQQKESAISKQSRRAMALLLTENKIASARIRTEGIIRQDILVELYEILELYCELLLARAGMLEGTELDPGLEEAVRSLVYASTRVEVKELMATASLLGGKYGKEFVKEAQEGKGVAEKVLKKLAITPPSEALVTGYLEEIASTYGVDWPKRAAGEPPKYEDDDDADEGQQKERVPDVEDKMLVEDDQKTAAEQDELTKATPPKDFGPQSPLRVNPPSPSTDNLHPRVKGTGGLDLKSTKLNAKLAAAKEEKKKEPLVSKGEVGGKIPDIDELAARFAALKK